MKSYVDPCVQTSTFESSVFHQKSCVGQPGRTAKVERGGNTAGAAPQQAFCATGPPFCHPLRERPAKGEETNLMKAVDKAHPPKRGESMHRVSQAVARRNLVALVPKAKFLSTVSCKHSAHTP